MSMTLNNQKVSHAKLFVREALNILFLLLILLAPWWIAAPFGFFLMLYFGAYEVLLGGIFMDMLYAHESKLLPSTDFLFTVLFLIAISVTYVVRKMAKNFLRI
jgi:hypothetical protein